MSSNVGPGLSDMSGDNSLARRRYSSANDLTAPLVSASSDAHCLPAVKGLERVCPADVLFPLSPTKLRMT